MKYNCLIIDDNEIERDLLETYLLKLANFNIVASCESSLAAINILNEDKQIDVVFSDIDMPDISGLELLKSIKNPPVFVFVTSYPEYAIDSIDLDALDFMVKPISLERLLKASNKIIDYLNLKQLANTNEGKFDLVNDEYFFIKDNKGHIKVNYTDLIYVESLGDFSKLIMSETKQHLILSNLKNLEKQLPTKTFTRVHRQYLININYLKELVGSEILLSDGYKIPLGSAYRNEVMQFINERTLSRTIKN
jgi:two-component system LytT family response regulator